jgi:hypothetical protein
MNMIGKDLLAKSSSRIKNEEMSIEGGR